MKVQLVGWAVNRESRLSSPRRGEGFFVPGRLWQFKAPKELRLSQQRVNRNKLHDRGYRDAASANILLATMSHSPASVCYSESRGSKESAAAGPRFCFGDRNHVTNRGSKIKDHKQRGEWAELSFMARAAERGLRVSKPWGDSARYDFAVEHQGKFLRVQVKSTIAEFCDGYVCSIKSSRGQHYTCDQVDFFAIVVIPEDAWYIFPAEVITKLKGHFMLNPRRKGQKYEPYLEAWNLLCGDPAPPVPAFSRRPPAYHAPDADQPVPQLTDPESESSPAPPPEFCLDDAVGKRIERSFEFLRARFPGKR